MTEEIVQALEPIKKFVHIIDHDTMGRNTKDEHIIATANGSWSAPFNLTMGDLRKIARLIQE